MIKPIKNNKQYELALARIYDLMQKEIRPNSKDSDEMVLFITFWRSTKFAKFTYFRRIESLFQKQRHHRLSRRNYCTPKLTTDPV